MDDEGSSTRDPRAMRDPQAIRALSHPLRLQLIELVGALGQATATQCAEHVGESVASCSFHLRQLEKYGFVKRDPQRGREKPWRLVSVYQDIDSEALDDEGRRAAAGFELAFLEWETNRLRSGVSAPADEWRQYLGGATTWITPDELAELQRDLGAVLTRHVGRVDGREPVPPGARLVRLFAATSTLPDMPGAAEPAPEEAP